MYDRPRRRTDLVQFHLREISGLRRADVLRGFMDDMAYEVN